MKRVIKLCVSLIFISFIAACILFVENMSGTGKNIEYRSLANSEADIIKNYYPTETNDVLNNPYMGWVPWAYGGPYEQPHKLVYAGITWRELEPQKGLYDFTSFEKKNKFDYWRSQGVKINLRIILDYPQKNAHIDIPDWLYNEIKGDGTHYSVDWGKGFSPNYSNTKLIVYHKQLISTLANRYNNDPIVANIQLGSLGHWGEWHTKKDSSISIPFPTIAVTDQYVQHYIDGFTNKILAMRRPFKIARDNRLGLFNDSFGNLRQTYDYFLDFINNGYTDYLTGENHPPMPDFWKYAPSGGEFANAPGLVHFEEDRIASTLQQIKDSHTSWLGPSCPGTQPSGTQHQANFDKVLKTMGYRFVLKSVSHAGNAAAGDSIPVTMEWNNKGVAPFYYNWPLELSLSDSNGSIVAKMQCSSDIRKWLPGPVSITENFNIPANIANGVYTLCIAIIDPDTGKPGIDLAINNRRSDGRYRLDTIKVALPSPWSFKDIGAPAISSSVSHYNGSFTISSAGENIGGASDQFAYMYQNVNGDVAVSARFVSQTYTSGWAKAGIMFRDHPDTDSRYISVYNTASHGLIMRCRSVEGEVCNEMQLGFVELPVYIKLERQSNIFYVYKSKDGVNWGLPIGKHTMLFNSNMAAGICVASYDVIRASTVKIDNAVILPKIWSFNSIGSPAVPGSAAYGTDTCTIFGAGRDIWGTSDQFAFVNKKTCGDYAVSARIIQQSRTHGWAKAGIMFRETLSADSKYVNLVVTPSNGIVMQWRDITGGTSGTQSLGQVTLPIYIRLERAGNTFYAYKSSNGISWGDPLASHTASMIMDMRAGLCVTSHDTGAASTVVFDNIYTR